MELNKKLNALVLDTETCFKSENANIILEIGWTVGNVLDKTDVPTSRRYIVADTLFDPELHWHSQKLSAIHPELADAPAGMRINYSSDTRYKNYMKEAYRLACLSGEALGEVVMPWTKILDQLNKDLSLADCIGAYNFPFDLRAMQTTTKRFHHHAYNNIYNVPHFCLMQMSANEIADRWYFKRIDSLTEDEKILFKSKSGKNLGYSAEIMARYISEDLGYIELHTAEEDSKIEYEIMQFYFMDKTRDEKFYSDYLGNVKSVSWTKLRDGYENYKQDELIKEVQK